MTTTDPTGEGTLAEADRREWRRHPGHVARLVYRTLALATVMASGGEAAAV